jgi:hypothetical protein
VKIKKIILSLLSIILFLILYKKFPKYVDQDKYIKIFFASITFVFIFASIFLKKKLQEKNNIIFIYFLIIIYSLNLLLSIHYHYTSIDYKKKKRYQELKIDFDFRDSLNYIKDSKDKNLLPLITPREIMKKNNKILILSGMPNSQYLQCNEFGNWKKIASDKYGFNNKSAETNYNILLAGDSFAHGVCVDQNYEIHNLLTKKGSKTYSIGYNANGPLLTLGSIIEISKVIKFDKIVWLFFRNDFYDVKWESKNLLLSKYLENDFEGYNYFNNFDIKSNYQKNYIKSNFSKNLGFNYWESFIQLKFINDYLNKIINKKKETIDKEIFNKIFKTLDLKFLNKKKILIYLPNQSCYKKKYKKCDKEFNFLYNLGDKNNIKVYDFRKKINSIIFKNYFALGLERNHYSKLGYVELSNYILEKLEKD